MRDERRCVAMVTHRGQPMTVCTRLANRGYSPNGPYYLLCTQHAERLRQKIARKRNASAFNRGALEKHRPARQGRAK